MYYLCMELQFETKIFGRQGNNVAISVVQVSLEWITVYV